MSHVMPGVCPACGREECESRVIDTRDSLHGTATRRRRLSACGERWSTYEVHESVLERLVRVENALALLRDTLSAAGVGIDVDGEAMLMRPKPGRPSDETVQEWIRDNDAGRSCGWIAARDGYTASTVELHIRKARKAAERG